MYRRTVLLGQCSYRADAMKMTRGEGEETASKSDDDAEGRAETNAKDEDERERREAVSGRTAQLQDMR